MRIEVLRPLYIRRLAGGKDLHLKPGPIDLPDDDVMRLITKKPDAVRLAVQPGDWVEWLSPALPKQQGEVLSISDNYFEVYHPLTETLCQLPLSWVTNVLAAPTDPGVTDGMDESAPSHKPVLRVSLNDPTTDARAIWRFAFPDEPWPLDARVSWVHSMGSLMGSCYTDNQLIELSQSAHKTNSEAVDTLIHELVHLRGYGRHNATFYRIENECRARLGLLPMPDERAERRAYREEKKRRTVAALDEWWGKYGKLPSKGDKVMLLKANSHFPAGMWGTIISVRGPCVRVHWGVTRLGQWFRYEGLRLIQLW